eukprot:PhM_4_TR16696/c0_g1_i1/m.40239
MLNAVNSQVQEETPPVRKSSSVLRREHHEHQKHDVFEDCVSVATDNLSMVDTQAPVGERKMTLWHLVAYAYILTAAGPFGLEPAVRAGGALATMVGLILTPILYVIPQVLLMSELSAMMPTNEGYVIWVKEGINDLAAFSASLMFIFSNIMDLSLYSVMCSNYITEYFSLDMGSTLAYVFKVTPVVFAFGFSLFEADIMASISGGIAVITAAPFCIGFFVAIKNVSPASQWTGSARKPDKALLYSSLVWMFTGWSSLGNLAGEVKNPAVYSVGVMITVVLDVLIYLLPLIASLTVEPNGTWKDGSLGNMYDEILPHLGAITSIACSFSCFGMLASSMACYARGLASMSYRHWVPRQLGFVRRNTQVPWVATVFFAIATAFAILFELDFLMKLDVLITADTLMAVNFAYVGLWWKRQDLYRPYKVPFGSFGALLFSGISILVIGGAIVINLLSDWILLVANFGLFAVSGLAYLFVTHRIRRYELVDPDSGTEGRTRLVVPGDIS